VTPPLRLDDYVERQRERIVGELLDWLRIPSVSADPAHAVDVRDSAEFAADLLRHAGFDHVALIDTPGAPSVYADWLHAGPDAPTVLVYGHHDVQPVDPLDAWRSPPFEPVIVDGECLARGAIDDKGQVLYEIEAARGLLETEGRLPVNLKFLIEGEEEVGSPHFEDLLHRHHALLACDAIVVSDTGMLAVDVPSTDVAMRGLVAFTVRLTSATTDLHSGLFGGAVPNPLHHLAAIVAALHDDTGRVALPGFYNAVRPLEPHELQSLAAQPFDEDAFMRTAGVERLEGEHERTTLERIGSRPTAEVVGLQGGYTGEGVKTIVPAWAEAKISFRLVADQHPDAISELFEAWVRRNVPQGIRVDIEPHGGVAPARTPTDHWSFGALTRAIERVWGAPPLLTRVGGSGPEEALGRVLAAPVLFLGVGLPDDRIHAPNERMVMAQFWRGLLAAGELWAEMAAANPRAWPAATPAEP
jgi:acetylornithine deacetylase/succinyl-diaminopimelate desuccinylase-like protein